MVKLLLLLLLAVAHAIQSTTSSAITPHTIKVDPQGPGLVFDGHGGLSAGASSRLLIDYVEPARTQILDYLWKPKFGASLQVCKVEIGGDTASTDGTEASHMHSRSDLNCTRGYEFWLMKEALARNPKITTYGLIWGAPGWINNQQGFFGPDMIEYQVNWLKCARSHHGIDVDYLGIWNERPWGSVSYTKQLREAIMAAGFKTQLVLGDGGMPPVLQSSDDADFMASFSAVGLHYPCTAKALAGQGPGLLTAGKKIWSSEDWWSEAEWGGAAGWARLFNQNFIRANITSTIAWSTVWSVYPNIDSDEGTGDSLSGDGNWGPGLIYAWEPHSGHYAIPDTVWTSAHTTQFTEIGWTIIHAASGDLVAGGSYVTMISPDGKDVTVVIETGKATNNCYKSEPPVAATQTLQLMLTSSLAEHKNLSLWRTTQTAAFEQLAPLQVTGTSGAFTLTVEPNAVYTISSTTGQCKGGFPTPPPASASFPFPYKDSFDASPDESLPRYFADQAGSFQVMPAGGGREGKAVRQRVTQKPGVNADWDLAFPLTALGNPRFAGDMTIAVDARVPPQSASSSAQPHSLPSAMSQYVGGGRRLGRETVLQRWVYANGNIAGGEWESVGNYTLAEAEELCAKASQCNALTFTGPSKSPTATQQIWLTSKQAIDTTKKTWHSYLLTPPHRNMTELIGSRIGLCGRVRGISKGPVTGICLQINATESAARAGRADWRLIFNNDTTSQEQSVTHGKIETYIVYKLDGGVVLAQGTLTGHKLSDWHQLSLEFKRQRVTARLDDHPLGGGSLGAGKGGMVALESGWHETEFDNFAME